MASPISSKLGALQAYTQPSKKVANRPDQTGPQQAQKNRRLSPALTVQLSLEAQKIMNSGGTPQKVAAPQKTTAAQAVSASQEYENGVGRREAPLSENRPSTPQRLPKLGSVLDIKV